MYTRGSRFFSEMSHSFPQLPNLIESCHGPFAQRLGGWLHVLQHLHAVFCHRGCYHWSPTRRSRGLIQHRSCPVLWSEAGTTVGVSQGNQSRCGYDVWNIMKEYMKWNKTIHFMRMYSKLTRKLHPWCQHGDFHQLHWTKQVSGGLEEHCWGNALSRKYQTRNTQKYIISFTFDSSTGIFFSEGLS